MTTRREITEWCKPFIERHPAMVQVRHMLVFAPIHHVMRAVQFLNSSYRNSPSILWSLGTLFTPQNLLDQFDNEIPVGHSDWPRFSELLDERGEAAIRAYLIPNETIEDFHRVAQRPAPFFVGDFRFFPRQHAIVLAALGRFEEAEELLIEPLAKLGASVAAQIEEGQQLVAKRPKSKAGKFLLENGARDAELAAELTRLRTALGARNPVAVAALLHRWEHENVLHWGVEQHWQPTPFPFELTADETGIRPTP